MKNKYLIQDKTNFLYTFEKDNLNKIIKLDNNLTENKFIENGFVDETIIKSTSIKQIQDNFVDKGSLGNGNLYEFKLNDKFKNIQEIK